MGVGVSQVILNPELQRMEEFSEKVLLELPFPSFHKHSIDFVPIWSNLDAAKVFFESLAECDWVCVVALVHNLWKHCLAMSHIVLDHSMCYQTNITEMAFPRDVVHVWIERIVRKRPFVMCPLECCTGKRLAPVDPYKIPWPQMIARIGVATLWVTCVSHHGIVTLIPLELPVPPILRLQRCLVCN